MADISVNLTAFSVRSFYDERQPSFKLNGGIGSVAAPIVIKHGDLPVWDRPNETLNGVPTAPTYRDNVNRGDP